MSNERSFGQRLRYYRRKGSDPRRGGLLTQERLGEYLGRELGHAGYSGAAVSDWERNKSKIDEEEWSVLLALITILHRSGGLTSATDADDLLRAGNYRDLSVEERASIFGESAPPPVSAASPTTRVKEALDLRRARAPGEDRRKLLILLEKVQRFWVGGVLGQALQEPIALDLAWQRVFAPVDHPWDDVLDPALYARSPQPDRDKITDVFADMDRALLILGGPGAGKTTTLLALARDLGRRAEHEATAPVPAVFNLAPWANRQAPLAEWLVAELGTKYQIPRQVGWRWLDADALILLLDGFDEMPAAERGACARAINRFREEHGLTGLVVCSRTAEYEAAGIRLKLGGAVLLQPLAPAHVDRAVATAGPAFAGLRAALAENPALCEMASSPLMLSIMAQTYRGYTVEQLSAATRVAAGANAEGIYEPLFEAYVQDMLRYNSLQPAGENRQTRQWLSQLAQQMDDHNQAVFLIEEIQPGWLPGRRWRRAYLLAAGLMTGLSGGLIMWILWLLLRQILPALRVAVSDSVGEVLQVGPGVAQFASLILGNLALGLLFGLIHILYFERMVPPPGSAQKIRHLRRRATLVGILLGGLAAAVVALFGDLRLALAWGLAKGVMYATISRYLYGVSYDTEIRTYEALAWSWPRAVRGALIGLLLTAAAELLELLLFGYNGIMRTLLTLGLATFLLGGMSGYRVVQKSRPNQGIVLSARNALLAALLVGLSLGALTWLLRNPRAAVLTTLLAGTVVFALFGGASVAKHYFVRLLLAYKGIIPLRLSPFLDRAVHLVLLRRVGGGFIFTHRLLQRFLARTYS